MTMALILSVPRRLAEGAGVLREGQKWGGWSPTWMLGHRIGGKRLGIVGMGRIGTAVARRARGFGLSIHYHNRRPVARAARGGARGDLLGEPRPDAGARRHRLGQLPGDARHLSPALAPPAEADARGRGHREHRARLDHRRGGADRALGRRRARRRRPRRLRARAGGRPAARSSSPRPARWCSCPTWAPPPSKAASTWARR